VPREGVGAAVAGAGLCPIAIRLASSANTVVWSSGYVGADHRKTVTVLALATASI
jgi:hypothetical protein